MKFNLEEQAERRSAKGGTTPVKSEMELIKLILWVICFFGILTILSSPAFPQAIVIDHTCTDLSLIPDAWLNQAKSDLHIVYQHTSHGSQLVTGMNALEAYTPFGSKYDWEDDGSPASALDLDDYGIPGAATDLSQGDYIDGNGVTPWVTSTRNLLDNPANAHVNVVMWSWCSINGHNIQRYLDNMEILVSEYPGVSFVFMTGHAEGQGEGNFIHTANEQIRDHCSTHGRILFDFADIENYDPDGAYYYDLPMWDDLDYNPGSTNNWGQEWCLANDGTELEQLTTGDGVSDYSGCADCAHSDGPGNLARINCVLKGRAAWWMFSRLAGWDGNTGSTPTPTTTPTPTITPTPTETPPFSLPVSVSFQPSGASIPDGYLMDDGSDYATHCSYSYGWR